MKILRIKLSLNIVAVSALFCVIVGATPENGRPSNRVNMTWPTVDQLISKFIDSMFVSNMPNIIRFSLEANISTQCQEAVMDTVVSIRKSVGWAVKMIDATGKIPSGILEGTILDFGSYDECLSIRANVSDDDISNHFRGQFCMVGFKTPLLSSMKAKTENGKSYIEAYGNPPEWMSEILTEGDGFLKNSAFWFGVCLPSKCSKDELEWTANTLSGSFGFTAEVADCQIDEPVQWNVSKITAMSLLCFLGLLILIGTAIDIGKRLIPRKTSHSNGVLRALEAFSAYKNTESFLRVGMSGSEDNLEFFNGIRFLSATWIILGHTYFFLDVWKYLKYRRLLGVPYSFDGRLLPSVIENFTIPVGSFFFMSGFLVTYTNWKKMEKSDGKVNVLKFLLHKYWRMTPALCVTMVLFFLLPLIDSGPLWNTTLGPPTEACHNLWWLNFFYIQNWWNEEKMCLIHTWYLAALMQFHLVAILLMPFTFRWPIAGGILGFLILTACSVLTGLQTVWNDFPMPAPGAIKDLSIISKYTSVIYIKSHAHVSEYLVGMTFGYLVLKYKNVKVRPMLQFLGWVLAVLCNLSVVYGISGPSQTIESRAVYVSLHRLGWALGLGWLTFTCAAGIGGIVCRILSWRAFGPLGQLGYLAYLLHPLVLWYRTASQRERVYYGHTELVYSFLAHTVVSFFLSYVCYIAVEKSFVNLETLAFSRSKSKAMQNSLSITNNDSSHVTTLGVRPYPSNNC